MFKKYQQCRVDVFTKECGKDIADWNNEAIIKYYDAYMENVYCDIGKRNLTNIRLIRDY